VFSARLLGLIGGGQGETKTAARKRQKLEQETGVEQPPEAEPLDDAVAARCAVPRMQGTWCATRMVHHTATRCAAYVQVGHAAWGCRCRGRLDRRLAGAAVPCGLVLRLALYLLIPTCRNMGVCTPINCIRNLVETQASKLLHGRQATRKHHGKYAITRRTMAWRP
jgi:hypothetical protein